MYLKFIRKSILNEGGGKGMNCMSMGGMLGVVGGPRGKGHMVVMEKDPVSDGRQRVPRATMPEEAITSIAAQQPKKNGSHL